MKTNQSPRIASAGLLCNRDVIGQEGWIHIVPKGQLRNAEAGVTQVLDDDALDSILANLQNSAPRGGLYMGEEHFIYDEGRSSEAFAWAKDFEKRADGIWAKPEMTDIGEPALKNKRFKFTSFVCDPNQPGSVEKLDQDRVRILRIDTVGFTNFPNGRHLLTPITNREVTSAASASDNQNQNQAMKQIASRLGLSADASEEAVIGELVKLLNRATEAEGKLTPITAERDLLKNRVTELLEEQIEADLDAHEITDAAKRGKLKPVLLPMKNRAERIEFLELMQPDGKTETVTARLTNRETANPPARKGGAAKLDDKAVATKIKNRAAELQGAAPKRSFNDCWQQAQEEVTAGK